MAAMVVTPDGRATPHMHNTFSLADLERAPQACNNAVIQTRRGQGGPILTLEELKNDADALNALVTKARVEPANALTFSPSDLFCQG